MQKMLPHKKFLNTQVSHIVVHSPSALCTNLSRFSQLLYSCEQLLWAKSFCAFFGSVFKTTVWLFALFFDKGNVLNRAQPL
jgi:hypothetical protein